jgi:Na+-translocating ferredoxin:NAD+ oxidoreductase RNF subunit RnfB
MKIDRQKLSKLSFTQKINCVYCGYANGIVAYLKAVVNQMEVYSCAIKHSVGNKATTHQKSFYKYEDFK